MRKSKKGLNILLLLPQRGCTPNFRKFGSSDLEKMRYERTDERMDGTEIIGPSGKIPGTNNVHVFLYLNGEMYNFGRNWKQQQILLLVSLLQAS